MTTGVAIAGILRNDSDDYGFVLLKVLSDGRLLRRVLRESPCAICTVFGFMGVNIALGCTVYGGQREHATFSA